MEEDSERKIKVEKKLMEKVSKLEKYMRSEHVEEDIEEQDDIATP